MDIRKVKLADSYKFEIKYPDGEPTGVVFDLRSPSCKEAEKVRRKWDNITSREKKGVLNYDQKQAQGKDFLLACIAGWSGLEDAGKPIEFSVDTLSELIDNDDLKFVFNQVSRELLEESNFLQRSGKS